MLTDALITLLNWLFAGFKAVVNEVLGLMPSMTLPTVDLGPIPTLFTWAGWLNHWVPLDVALTLVGLQLAAWIAWHGFYAVVWVLRRARVLG